ncbi:hypothetical protein AAFF_G00396490, partial [Aldrovandia affinis]
CLQQPTRGGHHCVLRRGSGAGRAGRDVLQQLLPLPAVPGGPERGHGRQPVGAEREAGPRESRSTGPLTPRAQIHTKSRRKTKGKKEEEEKRMCTVLYKKAANPGSHPGMSCRGFYTPWIQIK